jgi:hypothetical protein
MEETQSPSPEAIAEFARRQGINEEQARLRLTETDAQGVIEATVEAGTENGDPPDLRSDAKLELNNADATPGSGILSDLDKDDPNMASSG